VTSAGPAAASAEFLLEPGELVLEEVLAGQVEHDRKILSRHRHAALSFLGRSLIFVIGVGTILVVVGPRAATLLLVALMFTYLILRRAKDALPPAVRFRGVTVAAVTATVVLGMTAILALEGAGSRRGRLLLIMLGIMGLSIAFEIWLERSKPPLRVLVVGGSSGGGELAQGLLEEASPSWSLVGVVVHRTSEIGHEARELLKALVVERRPDLVVLTATNTHNEALAGLLELPKPTFRLVSFDHFCEYAFGRISVWSVSPMWFMSLLHAYRRPYRRVTKRTLDILLVLGLVLIAWPFIAAIMLVIWLSDRGSPFYRQVRVGEAGMPFRILKFRTMIDGAEAHGTATWADEDDARVTKVGRMLRRYRLDELPQIWNILRGEMSVVGPRPERPEFVEQLERDVPHWSRRHLVKPGLTGWAQVRMGYTADSTTAADKLAYDLYYVKHRALMLDLAIVLRTVGVVLRGQGAR
jgi:exopolysaccharide biosynthesis polyprenyl glycosylphosphotransferase